MNLLHGLIRRPHRQRHVLVRQLGSLSAEREECEDLVIGAGVVGICTAYSLARQGRRVKVLDQSSGPAQGSSWINGTLICPSLMLLGESHEAQSGPFVRPKSPLSPKPQSTPQTQSLPKAALDWASTDPEGLQVLLSAWASTESPSQSPLIFRYLFLWAALPGILSARSWQEDHETSGEPGALLPALLGGSAPEPPGAERLHGSEGKRDPSGPEGKGKLRKQHFYCRSAPPRSLRTRQPCRHVWMRLSRSSTPGFH